MKKLWMIALALLLAVPALPQQAAASTAECEIWLCLPGGFPSGCEPAYSAFKSRIRAGKSPLPPLSSCGSSSQGNYKMGYEPYENCKPGYQMRGGQNTGSRDSNDGPARCVETNCRQRGQGYMQEEQCDTYAAVPKPKPYFLQMWIDGEYQGKHYFSLR